MNKIKRGYFCPYCGKTYKNKDWSIDHIIPLEIGGPKMFKIISCSKCNNTIGTKIEQRAIHSPSIRDLLIQTQRDGFKIGSRRKKDYIPLHRGVGQSFGMPVKMFYNPEDNSIAFDFLGKTKEGDLEGLLKSLNEKSGSRGQAIIPIDEDTDSDIEATLSLVNKIVLGVCHWLWGEKFSKSKYGDHLRESMNKTDLEHVLKIEPSDRHFTLKTKDEKNNYSIEKDALDNTPHHTICIFAQDNYMAGLVNLFGKYESLTLIGKMDKKLDFLKTQEGIVIIAKITENKVNKMDLNGYKKFKLES